MIQVDTLLARLDGARQIGTDRYVARCPAHEDRSPSLSIRITDDKLLVHCFSGCAPDDILAAAGLAWSDLFSDRWQAAHQAALAAGHKRQRKMLHEIRANDYASWVVALAAKDKRAGIQYGLEDRATLAMAVAILEAGR